MPSTDSRLRLLLPALNSLLVCPFVRLDRLARVVDQMCRQMAVGAERLLVSRDFLHNGAQDGDGLFFNPTNGRPP